MSAAAGPLELIGPHLRKGTAAELAFACVMRPQFCRKFFTLETLVEVLRSEARVLDTSGVLELIRNEVVGRLLVTADRRAWRDAFLGLLRLPQARDTTLERFVSDQYHPRSLTDFARQEGQYLDGLGRAYEAMSDLRRPIGQA